MTLAVNIAQSGANNVSFRNRIINGAMVIDQRNAGASGTAAGYTVDRWKFNISAASKGTWGQNLNSITPPVGFTNYLGFQTAASGYSVGAADYFTFNQVIEGFNCQDLAWGTANAKTITLSFQVYSSLTGTFGGSLYGYQTGTPSYPFTYSIPVANTWTQISVTIAGPTSGTFYTNNSGCFVVVLSMGAGSTYSGTAGSWINSNLFSATGATSVVGTANATFYITGVQLEAGTTASPFEYRQYGTELMLCQRYFQSRVGYNVMMGSRYGTNLLYSSYALPVVMRSTPAVSNTSGWYALNPSASEASAGSTLYAVLTSSGGNIDLVYNSSFNPAGYVYFISQASATVPTLFSAEL
jgi:hypothetical protein